MNGKGYERMMMREIVLCELALGERSDISYA